MKKVKCDNCGNELFICNCSDRFDSGLLTPNEYRQKKNKELGFEMYPILKSDDVKITLDNQT